jgi:FkbM family methyltransferase
LPTTSSVIAIEPNPELIYFLRRNIKYGASKNVQVFPVAMGAHEGTLDLYQNFANCGDSRVFDPRLTSGGGSYLEHGFDEVPQSVTVTQMTIDLITKDLSESVQMIISDTQGWDHQVLRGAKNTIQTYAPKILVEFVPSWLTSLGEDPFKILNEYCSWGYNVGVPELGITASRESFKQVIDSIESNNRWFTSLALIPVT